MYCINYLINIIIRRIELYPIFRRGRYERSETLDEKLDQGIGCGNDDHCSGSHFCYGSRKGWVNEDGAAHYVDSNGSYVKISGKLPREFPIIWMKTEIWRRMYGLTVLTMPEKMAV